ncbi:MAG TPA: GNAT family N-acetyltransferase [Casimicrobiaceae bacterium]
MTRTGPAKVPASRRPRARRTARDQAQASASPAIAVRPARRGDLDSVIAIDATVTGLEKRDYWHSVFRRYAGARDAGRYFLVAEAGDEVAGFVIGEVRDWEFGSPPCGWVFGIDVRPDLRLGGVGTRLLDAICASFRLAGVRTVRTMLSRDNTLVLSFFRSQGMMAGPFIPLEMDLDA